MDLMLDFNISGEILIPIENSNFLSDKTEVTYKDLYECSYRQFRNVLFQGELIKFYILLKSSNIEQEKIKQFFENLYFKIEFESTGQINSNEKQLLEDKDRIEKNVYDLFTTNTEKINEKNYEYENVERKNFDEDSKIELYEVYKQIVVPKNLLNEQLIMKLQILTKNEDAIDFKENSDTYLYYKTGHFVNVQKYKILKTLFKEVKVIKQLDISDTKQIDLTLDSSLLQIKIDNITGNSEYEDLPLKNSRFLKKFDKNEEKEEKFHFGNDLVINEIEILEDETTIDEKETELLDVIKQYIMKKNSLMQRDINFKLLEKNLPVRIRPGEDYSISVKVNKTCFLADSDIKITSNVNNLAQQLNCSKGNDSFKNLGSILESNNTNIQNDLKVKKRMNSNAIVINRKSVFNQAQERILKTNNNINNQGPLLTESPMPLPEIYQKTVGNKYLQKTVEINEENLTENYNNTVSMIKEFSDENIKIYYITPVLLYISSKMFYENLFLCLQLKWYQELNRLLKIELKLPQEIYLYDYFEVRVKIRNISSQPMNLLIEMKEDENEVISDKVNNFEYMPSIISQIKFQSLGMFNCNEDKIFTLKFLTTKLGFTQLPNFAITDTLSNRRFYIVQNNKIFIKQNPDTKGTVNVLNRFISKTINE